MAEATCPNCGNQVDSEAPACPHCGTEFAQAAAAAPEPVGEPASRFQAVQDAINKLLGTTTTHRWWWAGGAGGAVVIAVLAVLFFTGVFGPSGKAICTATLKQARDFGVISPSATLASTSAKSTDVDGRKECSATVGDDTYTLLADVKSKDGNDKTCKDLEKQVDCIKLYSVARTDGMTTYQVREIPPDQTDEAVLAAEQQQASAPAPGGEAPLADPFAGETTLDTSPGAEAPPAPPPQQPQQ